MKAMEELMRAAFTAKYYVDNSKGANEGTVDIFAFLREKFPNVKVETVREVAEELAACGAFVERESLWAHAHGAN
jgi:hypothetical protein